ncbi:hypothetical protein VNO77_03495 [Canavalia gladiata]|uniref:Uncharacterized protein n=1 Tax=Canavalia gladiata TaxID=3824 RepID=A0AAN9MZY8_CANGL
MAILLIILHEGRGEREERRHQRGFKGKYGWEPFIHRRRSYRLGLSTAGDGHAKPRSGFPNVHACAEKLAFEAQLIPCMNISAAPIMHPYAVEIRSTIPIDYIMYASYVRSCDLARFGCVPCVGVVGGLTYSASRFSMINSPGLAPRSIQRTKTRTTGAYGGALAFSLTSSQSQLDPQLKEGAFGSEEGTIPIPVRDDKVR